MAHGGILLANGARLMRLVKKDSGQRGVPLPAAAVR
jgi:hypothetical protein